MKPHARISLHQLELTLSLGTSETERSQKQIVWIDIDIDFLEPPQACLTDQLSDTYCYDLLTQHIATQIISRSFHLLEHLAHEIYHLVKSSFTQPLSVRVKTTKKPLLSGGFTIANASFFYGDI